MPTGLGGREPQQPHTVRGLPPGLTLTGCHGGLPMKERQYPCFGLRSSMDLNGHVKNLPVLVP